jgi:hypothetical protein
MMGSSYAQSAEFPEARNLVQRVQEDMRRAADFARGAPNIKKDRKQIERWDNAQRSMSNFDKNLSRGKFDKGELDAAINDLKNVVDHNTLSSEDRDILNRDLGELRQFRANRY